MLRTLGLGLAVTMLATTAHAGLTQPAEVDVDLVSGLAQGDQVSARYSSNKTEYIGCGTRRRMTAPGAYFDNGFCQAQDVAGEQFTCFTTDTGLLEAIHSSGEYGFIVFSWDVATGECTRIGYSNQSFYLPKGLGRNSSFMGRHTDGAAVQKAAAYSEFIAARRAFAKSGHTSRQS